MMRSARRTSGFTLVELLAVMAIFGVVIGAVYSLYLTHQKTAYIQEDLVDLQQNLRIAMDSITRDMRMAGILVPLGTNPLANGSLNNYSTSVQINTASAAGQFARVAKSKVTAAFSTFSTSVDAPESIDGLIGAGAVNVRLIRPTDKSNPVSGMGTYLVLNAANRSGPSIALALPGGGTFSSGVGIDAGDIIAMAGPPVPPGTAPPAGNDAIVYSLIPCPDSPSITCLARAVNQATSPEVIASNISSLRFSYLYEDGTEDNNPADATSIAAIRSVRVTITGETSVTSALSEGPKTRQITSVIKLRNKR
ncbi:PilW family protein [Geobacter argillaceus]|uniref:Prepilin-type N-terminal cleavage/methylation domain-containing protein n=1 Tax=Geobacter argillaceus TaxID=345631 RepID=A0A562WQC4_9BACT|nr:prepilin-type N-terminal cleavage/methylation domain-containing protein [Geobacter argillaceus]TWJ32435.1 prepilin-type N-terminal cleavage/methylation domain-containing protein [Geobacter argillaceus]